jgi:prolipoprotein diacylglyceryltransferase
MSPVHGTLSLVQLVGPLTVLVVGLAFWGWMLRDMINNNRLTDSEKNTWLVMFLLLNVIGAAIYYVNVYRGARQ